MGRSGRSSSFYPAVAGQHAELSGDVVLRVLPRLLVLLPHDALHASELVEPSAVVLEVSVPSLERRQELRAVAPHFPPPAVGGPPGERPAPPHVTHFSPMLVASRLSPPPRQLAHGGQGTGGTGSLLSGGPDTVSISRGGCGSLLSEGWRGLIRSSVSSEPHSRQQSASSTLTNCRQELHHSPTSLAAGPPCAR